MNQVCVGDFTFKLAQTVVPEDEDFYKLFTEEGATVSEWDNAAAVAAVCEGYWMEHAEKLCPYAVEAINAIIPLRK